MIFILTVRRFSESSLTTNQQSPFKTIATVMMQKKKKRMRDSNNSSSGNGHRMTWLLSVENKEIRTRILKVTRNLRKK